MTTTYICPMHPEVTSTKPGTCSKCGMKLVVKGSTDKTTWESYLPLIVIIVLLLITALVISYRDFLLGGFSLINLISYFMAGFFIVFSGFKLMDLKGFAEGYATYDLLAQKWYGYGFIYPFIELSFGLSMILIPDNSTLLWLEVLIMVFSGVGVALKLLRHEKFQCSCLGTFLKVPLTKVTIIEDFGMAALALIMLLLR